MSERPGEPAGAKATVALAAVFVVVGVATLLFRWADTTRHGVPRWTSGGALVVIGILMIGITVHRGRAGGGGA